MYHQRSLRLTLEVFGSPQRVCVFCQHRALLGRRSRAFSTSLSRAARTRPIAVPKQSIFQRIRNRLVRKPADPASSQSKPAFSREPVRASSPNEIVRVGGSPIDLTEEQKEKLTPEEQEELTTWLARADALAYRQEQKIREREEEFEEIADAPNHPDYVPAVDWNGLEVVGGETEWDTGKKFKGFLAPRTAEIGERRRIDKPAEVTAALYRSVVETFTAKGAGEDPRVLSRRAVGPLLNYTRHVRVLVAQQGADLGAVQLEFPDEEAERLCLMPIAEDPSQRANESLPIPEEELEKQIQDWGREWHAISLHDPQIKFTLIKKLVHLIGRPIPDPIVNASTTVGQLLSHIAPPPAPLKLYESLVSPAPPKSYIARMLVAEGAKAEPHDLLSIPNVTVKDRKVTKEDRERNIGRWKIIERELKSRDLPVRRQDP